MTQTIIPVASFEGDPDSVIYSTAQFIRASKSGEIDDSKGTACPVIGEDVLIDHIILCEFVPANVPLNAAEILWTKS